MIKPFKNAQLFILVQERETWKAKDTQQVGWGSGAFAFAAAFPAPYADPLKSPSVLSHRVSDCDPHNRMGDALRST